MKKLLHITFVLLIMAGFASCSEDDVTMELRLNSTEPIELQKNGTASVSIESGNGGYAVKSSDDNVATATLSGKSVTIKGVGDGSATITITDAKNQSASVKVTVKYQVPTEPKLLWNGQTVEFDKAGGYGISILTNGLAITNLTGEKKQYYLTWVGDMSTGNKSEGKMVVAQEGKAPETTEPISINVIQSGSEGNFIMIEGAGKSGWIMFYNN
ncbi:MAG: hypothetical protein ACOYEA_08000 [Fermentimonas sp.]|jgi:hypothetical protein